MEGSAKKQKIVVITGPTATGKTELAFQLCQRFSGELVGADSMQIYAGLPIGTAAPMPDDHPQVPRHLVGFLPLGQSYSVADYLPDAGAAMQEIAKRGRLPVVCGGTGLYIDGIVNGIHFTDENIDESYLQELEQAWQENGGEAMLARLAALDPACAARLHPKDKKRILRALALSETQGTTLVERNAASRQAESPYDALTIALCYDDRQMLYRQIEARVESMMERGLLEEAREVYQNRERYKTAVQAIGYKEFFPYFTGQAPLPGCVAALKTATRRYAKRQLTWLRQHPPTLWISVQGGTVFQAAEKAVQSFLCKG